MSYDYNELVSKISLNRRLAAKTVDNAEKKMQYLQEAVDTFSTLSTQCPMTPLLWMQYSSDTAELLETLTSDSTSGLETHLQLLELALGEFPGSAILHLRYLQLLRDSKEQNNATKLKEGIQNAMKFVGKGSHRNEGELIAAIYRIDAELRVKTNFEDAVDSFLERSRVPMRNVNDGLNTEFQEFCTTYNKQIIPQYLQRLESGRRYEAKLYSSLVTFEDEVDMTMHAGGILPRHQVNMEDLDWKTILRSDAKTFWMGLGGLECANSFVQYAKACQYYKKPIDYENGDENDDQAVESKIRRLALCVYERGVAECPTVEALWLAYIKFLLELVQTDALFLPRLKSVVDRSVRNCPYSLSLFQQKIRNVLHFANHGESIVDSDDLMKIVKEGLDAKFITSKEACLELYMTAIQTLRRRILSLLALPLGSNGKVTLLPYDGVEPVNAKISSAELDEDNIQEIEDLCDDMREMYDSVDQYLRKHFSSWAEGRSYLWLDRSLTETHLVGPLMESFREERTTGPVTQLSELIRCFDKVIKIHQPAHPQSFASYIKGFLMTFPISGPFEVLSKLRQVRWLYQKALKSVGKPKHQEAPMIDLDYETSLRNLCYEYLNFERCFGSETSFASANRVIQKKLAKVFPSGVPQIESVPPVATQDYSPNIDMKDDVEEETTQKKRSREDQEEGQVAKKMKVSNDETETSINADTTKDSDEQTTKKTDLRVAIPFRHKVKVGNIDYPAHPFTIRVSNLADITQDMDLVDTFRSKCGGIVHAKIMREKHHHHGKGKSKGWGLIQFEEKDSVEKALELNDVIGINEKLVKIDRSHLPAVSLVPAGMHRVNPKGKGKNSKQNQKKAQTKASAPNNIESQALQNKISVAASEDSKPTKASNPSSMGVLAFRPRGVTQRKPKVSINKK